MSFSKRFLIFLFSLVLVFSVPLISSAAVFNQSAYEQGIDDPETAIDETVPKFRWFFPAVGAPAHSEPDVKSDLCIVLIVVILIMFFSLVVFLRC